MAGNVDTAKRGYQAFADGDVEGMKAAMADDIRWEGPRDEKLPGGGTAEGVDDLMQLLGKILEAWETFDVSPDEWLESGDTVIVLGHTTAKARETGTEVKSPFVHVWRYADGKATRVQVLSDTFEAAKALGLAS